LTIISFGKNFIRFFLRNDLILDHGTSDFNRENAESFAATAAADLSTGLNPGGKSQAPLTRLCQKSGGRFFFSLAQPFTAGYRTHPIASPIHRASKPA
jgi:hypothetical protein